MSTFIQRLVGRAKTRAKIELTGPPKPPEGFYHAVWERKRLPGPGAMNYAYEALGLVPMTPIGPATRVKTPMMPFAQIPVVQAHTASLVGMPTVAGQYVHQPLWDGNAGSFGGPSITSSMNNMPFQHHDIQPAAAGTLS